ncbi:MAG TPA: DinB family protein [Chloroflexota bacterium]|nr:DinB family protein [Chloroflexota bacterium]HZU08211.1 DinB family protein [Chloroflexota bacterium]
MTELERLRTALYEARAALRREVEGLDPALAAQRPAPEEWSIVENLLHVADMDLLTVQHLRRILQETEPVLPATRGDEFAAERAAAAAAGLDGVLARLDAARAELLALCESLDEAALARGGLHPKFGRRTVAGWLEQRIKHDRDHQAQIRATRESLARQRRG